MATSLDLSTRRDADGAPVVTAVGLHVLAAFAPGLSLIAGPLLAPVLAISGLSDVTSVRE